MENLAAEVDGLFERSDARLYEFYSKVLAHILIEEELESL